MKTESPIIDRWESLSRDPLLSVRQIESAFGFDVTTIRRWIREHKLRSAKIGGQIRARTSEVLSLIHEMETEQ